MGVWNNALILLVFCKPREYRHKYQAKRPAKQYLKPHNQADNVIECYSGCEEKLQPVVSIYPGFLNLRLYDRLYEKIETNIYDELSGTKKRVLELYELKVCCRL